MNRIRIKRLKEYEDLGIDTFVLSGYPHLEESYRVAELLFPRLNISTAQQRENFTTNLSAFVGEDGTNRQ